MATDNVVNTRDRLEGMLKETYAEGVPNLIPDGVVIQKEVKFSQKEKVGNKYHFPVRLTLPNGFTYAQARAGAFALNKAKAGITQDAEADGSQILLRDMMDYETAHKCLKSKASFIDGTAFMYEGMQESAKKRLEISLMYGGAELGVISSVTHVAAATTATIVLTAASWAPGVFAGLEGAEIDVYDGSTKQNSNADIEITSVAIESRTLEVSGNATDLAALAAGEKVYFKGAYGKEMKGVQTILETSGDLFGIDSSVYSLWKATSHAAGGALSFSVIKKGIMKAMGKGLSGELLLSVNPGGWNDIHDSLTSLRRTDKSEVRKLEIGADEIEFSINGIRVKVKSNVFQKEGTALGLHLPSWKRIGATDVTFNDPQSGGQTFLQMPDNAGFEVRCYTHQCIVPKAVAKNILFTGVVNT